MNQALRSRIDDIVSNLDLDEWMTTWRVMQGGRSRERHIRHLVEMIPYEGDDPRILDLCCGPGDVGRAVRTRYPDAAVTQVDRDEFFLSLCRAVNRQVGHPNHVVVPGDLWDPDWSKELGTGFHGALLANALHWFNDDRLLEIFREIHAVLAPGGVFAFLEPVSPVPELSRRHVAWMEKAHPGMARRYDQLWDQFWAQLNREFGFDYYEEVTAHLPAGREYGDDNGLYVSTFLGLLHRAGFRRVDVLARDPQSVCIAAIR